MKANFTINLNGSEVVMYEAMNMTFSYNTFTVLLIVPHMGLHVWNQHKNYGYCMYGLSQESLLQIICLVIVIINRYF